MAKKAVAKKKIAVVVKKAVKKAAPKVPASPAERHRLAGIRRLAAAGGPSKIIRIPITNVLDGSDYSAQLSIGSGNAVANVILDTGSSTLGIDPAVYSGKGDKNLTTTPIAQWVSYGTGGWAGPVVNTSVSFGGVGGVTLKSTPVAITLVQQKGNFQGVSGIMGLAYNGLNGAFDLTPWFKQQKKPAASYPWPFPSKSYAVFIASFQKLLKSLGIGEEPLTPYFDDLENIGVVANKFAFYTLRSWVSLRGGNNAAIAKDVLNQGIFVLGGGEEQTDLFQGAFVNVDVLDDQYYNTNLKSVQVGTRPAVAALPLQAEYVDFAKTNSIIDSGTSDLTLAADVYQAILSGLGALNPAFTAAIQSYNTLSQQNKGLPVSQLNLASWPNIYFTLAGENGEDIKLTVTPQTYWQVDFPAAGQAAFQISGPLPGDDENQSILGLPLLNNYYTVFDRSLDSNGVIRFAPIKLPAGV